MVSCDNGFDGLLIRILNYEVDSSRRQLMEINWPLARGRSSGETTMCAITVFFGRRVEMVRKSRKKQEPSGADPGFEPVAAAFAGDRQVKRGRMFSSENVLSVNGKIFAMLTRGRFVVKLPKERVDQLVDQRIGLNWGPGPGRVMREWVAVESGKS